MKTIRTISQALILMTLVIGCTPIASSPTGSSVIGGLQAWVDAPLEGTVLTLPVIYRLVCHGTDPSGVNTLEFSVNGEVLITQTNPQVEETLYDASVPWEPTSAGNYTIRCRTQNSQGEWSNHASAKVTVQEPKPEQPEITPTFTPTFTDTPTLTPTMTLTSTSTPTVTITPTLEGMSFTNRISSSEFQYQRDCIPSPPEVTISAVLSNAANVKYVFLFFRLESEALGITTDWNTGMPMTKTGNGIYSVTVNWRDVPQLPQISGSAATFVYQFVVVGQDNSNIGRSQGFRDITFRPCN